MRTCRQPFAITIPLCLLTAASTFGAHELMNASFEEPGGEAQLWISDRAARWDRWGGWFNRETSWTPVADGQCIMAYHHWKIQGHKTAGIYQDIPNLPPDQYYEFNIQATKDKFTNAEYIELRLEPLHGGKILASQKYHMNTLKSGKWTTLTVKGSSPKTGLRVLVIVKPGHGSCRKGSIKFDSATLKPIGKKQLNEKHVPFNKPIYTATQRRK